MMMATMKNSHLPSFVLFLSLQSLSTHEGGAGLARASISSGEIRAQDGQKGRLLTPFVSNLFQGSRDVDHMAIQGPVETSL